MKVIGVTGGIGSGKSAVLDYMQEYMNAAVCQADLVAHRLQQPGQICYFKIIEYFGDEVIDEQQNIDRKKLSSLVFADRQKLDRLNQIVHPEVKKYIQNQIQCEREKGTRLFVVEAALLIEDHYETLCDEFWYIYADEATRRERLKQHRGYTDEKIDAVFASQASEDTYRAHCRHVINNSGNFAETRRQIRYLGEENENETM